MKRYSKRKGMRNRISLSKARVPLCRCQAFECREFSIAASVEFSVHRSPRRRFTSDKLFNNVGDSLEINTFYRIVVNARKTAGIVNANCGEALCSESLTKTSLDEFEMV